MLGYIIRSIIIVAVLYLVIGHFMHELGQAFWWMFP